jgi:hypothetical protein
MADAVTVAGLALGVAVAASGGFRWRVGETRISLTSAPRILLAILVIGVIRHLLVRRDPLYARVVQGVRSARQSEALRAVLPLWLTSRLLVLAVGFLAVAAVGFPMAKAPFRVYHNELLNLPARLDTGWYFSIATEGYQWSPEYHGQQNIAFMPALPMLMRFGGRLLGDQPLIAGQVLVLVACLWGFVYVYRLARAHLGDPERAAFAVALLATYPFAVFLGAVYTESLFLLCAAGGFYHASRRDVWPTAAFALLVGLARPNGFLLSVPLGVLAVTPILLPRWSAVRGWTPRLFGEALRRTWPTLAAAAAAVVGVVVFSAFIYSMTGRPFTWLEAHAAWGRTFTGALDFVTGPYAEMNKRGAYEFVRSLPIDTLNGIAAALALVASVPVTRRYGLAYGVFIWINLLPPLMMGGWLSIGRVTLGMFPVFIWLADVIPARHRTPWLIGFALLQGFAAVLFYTWRPFI